MADYERGQRWTLLAKACGGRMRRLPVEGRPGFVLEPEAPAQGRPWVLYAPTLREDYPTPRHTWIFSRLLADGITVTGVDVGETWGSPSGRTGYTRWYQHVTRTLGLAPRVCLVPQSRGGPMLYNWAVEHPEWISGVTGIYTVCDLRACQGASLAFDAFRADGVSLERDLSAHNPVDRLAPLARLGVPLFHIHGDSDDVVPLEPNAGELVRRYRSLGGPAELLTVPGYGHEEHAIYFERDEVIDSIRRQAKAGVS